jgi:hypothetical protein
MGAEEESAEGREPSFALKPVALACVKFWWSDFDGWHGGAYGNGSGEGRDIGCKNGSWVTGARKGGRSGGTVVGVGHGETFKTQG